MKIVQVRQQVQSEIEQAKKAAHDTARSEAKAKEAEQVEIVSLIRNFKA